MTDTTAILTRLRETEAIERRLNRLPYADELKEEIELIGSLAKCIVNYVVVVDWACAECRANSDLLVDGFQCGFHKALAITEALSKSNGAD